MASSSRKSGRPRLRMWVILAGVALSMLSMLAGGLIAGAVAVNAWLKGDGFRDLLTKRAASALSAKVEITELRWDDQTLNMNQFVAVGREGADFSKGQLEGIHAKFEGVNREAVLFSGVGVNRLVVDLSPGREPSLPVEPSDKPKESRPRSQREVPAWLKAYLPRRIDLDVIDVGSATVFQQDVHGTEQFSLKEAALRLEPDFEQGIWAGEAQGGTLQWAGAPPMELLHFKGKWMEEHGLEIDSFELTPVGSAGRIRGHGTIGGGKEDSGLLQLELSGLPSSLFLDQPWSDRIEGALDGEIQYPLQASDQAISGVIRSEGLTVTKVPILKHLARFTKDTRFENLVIHQLEVEVIKDGERTEFTSVALQSDGLLRLEGAAVLEGEQLNGSFQLGVSPGTLRWIPGAEQTVFLEERDGFRWTSLQVSGTRSQPKEDLSARLIGAAGRALLDELTGTAKEEAEKLLDAPDASATDPSSLIQEGRKLLDRLLPSIGQ